MALLSSELIDAFVQRKATIFVGAGASRASGLPDWKGLMEPLRRDIDDCPDELSPLDIAQYFVNDNGQRLLAERLSEVLNKKGVRPNEIHNILVRLPVDRIYTTNFNELLELSYENQKGHKAHKIVNASKLATQKGDRLNIIKMHGDFDDPQTIVTAAESFEDYFASHPVLAQQLASEISQRTALFVGYSFNDPDVRTIARGIRRDAKEYVRNHSILTS